MAPWRRQSRRAVSWLFGLTASRIINRTVALKVKGDNPKLKLRSKTILWLIPAWCLIGFAAHGQTPAPTRGRFPLAPLEMPQYIRAFCAGVEHSRTPGRHCHFGRCDGFVRRVRGVGCGERTRTRANARERIRTNLSHPPRRADPPSQLPKWQGAPGE